MSNTATTRAHNSVAGLGRAVLSTVSRIHVDLPATRKDRASVLADARAARGLDLSDEARVARIRKALS